MNKVINNISKYSFTKHFLNSIIYAVELKKCAKIVKTLEFFSPPQKDTLFWCLYIIKHGFLAYDILGDKYFSNEKMEKFKYIELLRQNKAILKEHKIKPLSEIEDNIANNECISIKTLSALVLLENINIMIIFKKTYCEFINNPENPIHIIHKNDTHNKNDKYKYELVQNLTKLQFYKDNYINVSSFENPLMPISSYKISDLTELCNKIGIIDIKQSKNNLYQLIITTLKN